ncbi:hypothetical protein VKT23_016660 [Stygiomarasmius scandens]|uniref:DUF6532 domain-containing protein n=1 Tax=Marasmiellus scandens TaxID=2682957 RepID=A0ABR1IU45_9AGAR
MSQTSEGMKTRGAKVNIDPSLLSKTQVERRIEREAKNAEKEASKKKKAEAAMMKKEQRREAEERIAAAEDAQAQKRVSMFSVRPDITANLTATVTTAHGATRGHGGARSHGVAATATVPAAPAIRGKASGRGGGRGRVRGRGRGGIVPGPNGNAVDAGEEERQVSPVYGNVEITVANEEHVSLGSNVDSSEDGAAVFSDVEIPPVTDLDTESEGPVEGDVTMDDGEGDIDESSAMLFEDYSDNDGEYCGDEEDYEEEEEEMEIEAEAKPKKKQPKSKADPRALREDITAARAVKPIPLVQPLKNAPAKRRGSAVESQPLKKRPKAKLGGLDDDWKQVYGSMKPTVSSSSVVSTGAESSDVLITTGQFDRDESPEALQGSRQAKEISSANSNGIVLAKANVAEIDKKDREKTKGFRTVTSSKDLPSPDFDKTLEAVWNRWFSHLPPNYQDEHGAIKKRVDHPAIRKVAISALSSYRSDLAKKALAYVEEKMFYDLSEDADVEEVKSWVEGELLGMAILYEFPGETPNQHRGLFKSKVVSQTLAWHLIKIRDSPRHQYYGYPVGTLALVAAAIKRALNVWKEGYKLLPEKSESDIKQAARNGPHSFSQTNWGGTVRHYYDLYTSKLAESKLDEIAGRAEEYLPEKIKQLHQPAVGIDENDILQLSD